ncbi:Odorant receptor 32 [Cephus cinctus]|uniref:Odorant receptor n=1 Tax=Cephus cinctus TaxID=211228 RepID=S5TLY7_CEPCN|nr:odorant receptor 13a-like [Cephus cinctus]AGS43058.1 odorant receptor Or2i [Cephus cinctus]RLZ02236.1 Odorant receptor 32 [Cephus cinctus]
MSNLIEGYTSTKISQILITLIGMKRGKTKREQLLIDGLLVYIFATVLIAIFVENSDLIYSRNDLYALTYNAPCSFAVTYDFVKLLIFTYKRRELYELHKFTEDTFWNKDYNELDKAILDKCDSTSAIGMCVLSVLATIVAIHYLTGPYWDAVGTNTTERTLPFRVVFDLPLTVTPYYEISYVIEVIGAFSVGLCSVAFASYLFYTCTFVSGHFKILQRELENVCEVELKILITKSSYSDNDAKLAYEKFKKCIVQHELLIGYLGKLESLFSYIFLMLVLCIVIILCFSGFQFILGDGTSKLHRQILSAEYIVTTLVETGLFAFSCNEIFEASAAIGEAAYRCKWYKLPCDENGRALRQGMTIMVMRSYKPCSLTVGKFCPMNLQVFSSVLSTSLSYFTVLRSMNESE